jgi:hypothetical protein
LLPIVARHGGELSEEGMIEMLVEHARIRGLGDEVTHGVRPETGLRSGGQSGDVRCSGWSRAPGGRGRRRGR